MRIVSIVGARPQFVKAAVVCRAIESENRRHPVEHHIIHTGQHYDAAMSDVFFDELGIPAPRHHLGVGSATHAVQTAEMMKCLEPVLASLHPDWVLLYGDTNSTLAGAVVSSKLGLRTAHVEAGLRSFNRSMPEEINRIVADHLSDLLLAPTGLALTNLTREGLNSRCVVTGDVMLDANVIWRRAAEREVGELARQWAPKQFALATVHRAENTDNLERLRSILRSLERIAASVCPVVFPVHPRTRKQLASAGWTPNAVTVIDPISYLEMLLLESRARFILTDSGGVQKEAYFVQVPCITLRDETEWEETLANGCNVLTGANEEAIMTAVERLNAAGPWSDFYGDGTAGENIIRALHDYEPPT